MTKAELNYSRSLSTETNSVPAGLDSTKLHDAVDWGHLRCAAVEKVKIFSGNAVRIEWRVLIEEASPGMPTSSAPWSSSNLRDVAIQV